MATDTARIPGSRPLSYDLADLPDLISIQTESYEWFLEEGLKELFESFSPIEDYTGNIALEFLDFTIGEPTRSMKECRERDATYEAPLHVKVRLVNKEIPEITESEVYLGELPIMTDRGKFIINGAKRVVISQLARSPGVYFRDTIDSAGRVRFSAKVIPSDGAWVEIDTAANGVISVKLGQTRKFPVTALLRALEWLEPPGVSDAPPTGTDEEILHCFGYPERVDIKELNKRLAARETEALPGIEVYDEYFATRTLTEAGGDVIVHAWEAVDRDALKKIQALGRKQLDVIVAPFELRATLDDDESSTAEQGLQEVYRKIRPGDPPTVESAESLLKSYFFDVKRYDLSRVGRYKTSKKLGANVPLEVRTLTRADLVAIVRYLLGLPRNQGEVDDIDHLQNKRVRAVGELLQSQLRTGFMRTERVAKERMTSMDPDEMVPGNVISTKPISAAINSFFGSGQLSQFMDEVNPLAELAHTRRLSALGPGGLSKQSAKLEVRDVHHSHYGRICPIQSPEGQNVGLIGYLALHARLDEYGFIETPYRKAVDGRVTDDVVYMTADEEEDHLIATLSEPRDENGRFVEEHMTCRYKGTFATVSAKEVEFCDLSASQVFSVSTGLIPFLEHDDAVRALAGSNMQRQAVPLIRTEPPWIKSGLETRAAADSGVVVIARKDGRVVEANAQRIVVEHVDGTRAEHDLDNFIRTNMGTCVTQRRLVREGDLVTAGQPVADGPATANGELALGRNLLVAFLPWEGYNFEDAILISERLLHDDTLTSVHIEKYECEARETKLGPEEITRDIPNVGDDALADLDANGMIRVGAEVRAEDILVGKVAPKGKSELTAEEKLVIAIFGKKAEEMRDVSLRVPHGEKGVVIDTKVFSRYKYECQTCGTLLDFGKEPEYDECPRCAGKLKKLPGDELKPGVNQLVRVFVAQRRKIMVGDKLTGRHGNKGVIAKILPVEDMPYLPDGRPVDVCLNPLTVPSRMNIGQILETHLGLIAHEYGAQFTTPIFEGIACTEVMEGMRAVSEKMRVEALRSYADCELNHLGYLIDGERLDAGTVDQLKQQIADQLAERDKVELEPLAAWLDVSPHAWPQVDQERAVELVLQEACRNAFFKAGLDPDTGKTTLYDGRSGEPFDQPVMVGYMYILKLLQLVEDKIHARSTGPYSLITQQPLGGKAQFGGQRFGEMEVWALEAYGAAHALQEMLTVKSDDVQGRVATYEAIVKDENIQEPGVPEAFKILVNEMRSLALDVQIEDSEGEPLDIATDDGDLR
jgi:DNA-directed RNA polymerase subunit beta